MLAFANGSPRNAESELLFKWTRNPEKYDRVLIVVDSSLGLVWKVDVWKGEYEAFIHVSQIKIAANSTLQLRIIEIHISNEYLYFTSVIQEIFCRLLVTLCKNRFENGTVEDLARTL